MKQSDIVAILGSIMILFGIVAEIWETKSFNIVPTNFEMILMGFIVLLMAIIIKISGYDAESQDTSEKRRENNE